MYDFDWNAIVLALPFLWDGMVLTCKITFVAISAGILIGTGLALLRLANLPVLSSLAAAYINFFRSIPLLMVLLWFFLIIPQLFKQVFQLSSAAQMRLPLAMLGFALFEAAYYAEIIRAGIQGIRHNQILASYALGLNYVQTMRWIILPQAFRKIIPVLLTQAIILFQDTSLVYIGGLNDFFNTAAIQANIQHRYVEFYIFAAIIYLILCSAASYIVSRLNINSRNGRHSQ